MINSIEHLLTPRFKVIADFPGCPWLIGRVLVKEGGHYECHKAPASLKIRNPEKFPAVFKKLEWHEERTLEEMPQYVKKRDEVYKVLRVEGDGAGELILFIDENDTLGWYFNDFQPATEEDYNNYLQSK